MTTIEKIRAEIERRMSECHEHLHDRASAYAWEAQFYAYKGILSFIESLEKENRGNSLKSNTNSPKGLDEAAEEYVRQYDYDNDGEDAPATDAFKAGAEWQAEQGEIIEGSLSYGPHLQRLIITLKQVPKIWDGHCQDVIVQIRKKED